MKNTRLHIALALTAAILTASCGSSVPPQSQNINAPEDLYKQNTRHNPVFALFDSNGQGSYLLYRNSERIASFTLGDNRKPIELCSHNSDCYILVSGSQPKDSTDTLHHNAEILKNGRRAMELDDQLQATHFDMDEGHFYVLGKYGETEYTIYRDGLRILSLPAEEGCTPADFHVYRQTIYIAMQRGKTTDIYKDNNKLYSINGICKDIKASLRGVYLLMEDTLYLDKDIMMHNEYYRYSDKEMYATPTMVATSDQNVLVGSHASFDNQHSYASIFLNTQAYATIKPDDKRIGLSELNTACCGVAVSNETFYFATTTLAPDMSMSKPITYHFYNGRNESFALTFDNDNARLLMMSSN